MLKKTFPLLLLLGYASFDLKAQSSNDSSKTRINKSEFRNIKINDKDNCLYYIKPSVDIPITGLGIAGTIFGYALIGKKSDSDSASVANLTEDDLEFPWDKAAIDNYNTNAASISDIFLYSGFVYGFTLMLDKDIRKDALKIILLYLETMSLTGTSYAMASGLTYKYRPYAYNPDVKMSSRTSHFARNSFYSGHTSVPAASALFVASVYSTYHPHSKFRYVLYGVAVAATGTTTYLRYVAGQHFATDLALGVVLGIAYGLMVPKLHKCKDGSGLSLLPLTGAVKGVQLGYTF